MIAFEENCWGRFGEQSCEQSSTQTYLILEYRIAHGNMEVRRDETPTAVRWRARVQKYGQSVIASLAATPAFRGQPAS